MNCDRANILQEQVRANKPRKKTARLRMGKFKERELPPNRIQGIHSLPNQRGHQETHPRGTPHLPRARHVPGRQIQALTLVRMVPGMKPAPILCQIDHFTPSQVGLTFPYQVTSPQNGLLSQEGMNAVMAGTVVILEQEILEKLATHAMLVRLGILGIFASIETTAISAIHGISGPLTRIG